MQQQPPVPTMPPPPGAGVWNPTPTPPIGGMSFGLDTPPMGVHNVEERLRLAAADLLTAVQTTRKCNELRRDLEFAAQAGIDLGEMIRQVEVMLMQLIEHAAGNYLVTKCFDLCPRLIDVAAGLLIQNVRHYALHKHASYVVEAVLEHACGSPEAKAHLVAELIAPYNRRNIGSHDSGNFVMQKAIENAPDDLLPLVCEAVQEITHLCSHGSKMQKKLTARLQRSPNFDHRRPARRHTQTPQLYPPPPRRRDVAPPMPPPGYGCVPPMPPYAEGQWYDAPPVLPHDLPFWAPSKGPMPPQRVDGYEYCGYPPIPPQEMMPPPYGPIRTPQPGEGMLPPSTVCPDALYGRYDYSRQLSTPAHSFADAPAGLSTAPSSATPSSASVASHGGARPAQRSLTTTPLPTSGGTPIFRNAGSIGSWADVTEAEEEAQNH
eukprot:Hpha_TRINITY_DN16488_c1_g6::TRINITY_DN16488_c1_g6_i1::g.163188::m.163188